LLEHADFPRGKVGEQSKKVEVSSLPYFEIKSFNAFRSVDLLIQIEVTLLENSFQECLVRFQAVVIIYPIGLNLDQLFQNEAYFRHLKLKDESFSEKLPQLKLSSFSLQSMKSTLEIASHEDLEVM